MSFQQLIDREQQILGDTPPHPINIPDEIPPTDCQTFSVEHYQPLLEMAGPDIYMKNVFRMLGMPCNATAADVKRQFDKRQMMLKYGDNTTNIGLPLPIHPSPGEDEIREAVYDLREPEHRLLHELLWFWPANPDANAGRDIALEALKNGDLSAAVDAWTNEDTLDTGIAIHNLAILYHVLALDFESRRFWGDVPEDAQKYSNEVWRSAYKYWNRLFCEETFWRVFTSRITDLDEARLSTDTALRLKAALPLALLSINAKLSVEAAEYGKDSDARRQVEIMRESGFDSALIDTALREAVEPISKRIQTILDKARTDAESICKEADKATLRLFEHCDPLLEVFDVVLDNGNASREHIRNQVAETAVDCIVLFGKETEDWPTTVSLLKRAESIAEGQQIRNRVAENLEAAESISHGSKCWFCESDPGDDKHSFKIKMFGNVKRTPTYEGINITWQHITINVPRCEKCSKTHGKIAKEMVIKDAFLYMFVGIIGIIIWNDEGWFLPAINSFDAWFYNSIDQFSSENMALWFNNTIDLFPLDSLHQGLLWAGFGGLAAGALVGAVRGDDIATPDCKPFSAKNEYPKIKSLLDEGWGFGEKPSVE